MRSKITLTVALLILISTVNLHAQTRGRGRPAPRSSQPVTTQTAVTKDGRTVLLKSDGTWEYTNEATTERSAAPQPAKQNGVLSLEAGLVYKSGDVKPVARTEFNLLDQDLVKILGDAGVKPPEKGLIGSATTGNDLAFTFALAAKYNSLPDNQPFYLAAMEALKPHIVKTVTTDFGGKASFEAVPAGTYYLMGLASTPNGFAFWTMQVEIKAGQNSLVLDQNNAAYAH